MSLDKSTNSERLSFTVFLAVAAHAIIILGMGFGIEDLSPKPAPTLNITLATHQSRVAPEQANFLAQHNQEASGTKEETLELTTREYADIAAPNINQITPNPQRKSAQESAAEQQYITASDSTFQLHKDQELDEQEHREPLEADQEDNPMVNPEIASLRAKLDRLQQEFAERPRIRRLTSVASRSSIYAEYLNKWTQKVELMGNEHFPEAALEQRIFGSLRLSVIINSDGSIEQVELLERSGYPILDQAALQIVRLSGPFEAFPGEIRQEVDQLDIIRTWRFEITGLTTDAQSE